MDTCSESLFLGIKATRSVNQIRANSQGNLDFNKSHFDTLGNPAVHVVAGVKRYRYMYMYADSITLRN